jgi:hypothetical protein
MGSNNSKVSLDACSQILDRAGLSVALQIKAVPPDEKPQKLDINEVRKALEQRKLKE